jgi:hypothetical protein
MILSLTPRLSFFFICWLSIIQFDSIRFISFLFFSIELNWSFFSFHSVLLWSKRLSSCIPNPILDSTDLKKHAFPYPTSSHAVFISPTQSMNPAVKPSFPFVRGATQLLLSSLTGTASKHRYRKRMLRLI